MGMMRAPFVRLTRMAQRERSIVRLIRSSIRLPNYPDDSWTVISRLRELAVSEGLSIMPVEASFASRDEMKILGNLAMLQRQHVEYDLDVSQDMHAALRDCAILLDRLQLRLDWRNIVRVQADRTNAPRTSPPDGTAIIDRGDRPRSIRPIRPRSRAGPNNPPGQRVGTHMCTSLAGLRNEASKIRP
jgi:hypothetical protein